MNGFKKPHIVAVPFPALGHFIPFLDLAKLLASNGLTVSYVTTPANVSRLQGYLVQALNDGLDIRLVALPTPAVEGLQGCESNDLLPLESRSLIFELAKKLQNPFGIWMEQQFHQQTATPPVCIVYDMFMGWAVDTAQKFNIRCILFNTCGAFAISLIHSISCSILQNTLEKDGEDSLVLSLNMPRPVRLFKHEVSPAYFNPDLSSSIQRFVRQCHQEIGKCSGTLINTFHDLEPLYVQHLKTLTEEQTHALARGLEASEQPFVWTIKVPPKIDSASSESTTDHISTYLPEGFLERTKGRGLIIRGWAPQLVILSHISVGAFISHCGWNSALESISLGVPILAWPMFGDQHFNSKLFAELGVGIQFCQNRDEIPKEESIKKAVTMALTGDKR
ncbi:hypothetical protein SUGI_0074160 [Cryptomeria japonica]|nr:hypothetical protein SUGI_0074160 [Cryptomeria japonica]